MRNTPDYFYDQQIRIGGMRALPLKQAEAKNPDVQFFPEGGQLVNDVRSRIAVKSVGTNGLAENVKGSVEDNEGNIVAEFETRHLGMGVFALIPQSGKSYKAKIIANGGPGFTVDLPKAEDTGYTLALNNSHADSIFVKIAVNNKLLSEKKGSTFYIIAQSDGKVYYTAEGKLDQPIYMGSVEKNRFPMGISQFTLFSQTGEPLAERIAFIQSDDTLKLTLNPVVQSTATRGNVKINLNVKDGDLPANANFSVAVINESRALTNENTESTIMSNLLLTSELKGYIEQPVYYFTTGNHDQKQADLDILMLTQGYRRFNWKQVLNNPAPAISYQPEQSLALTGTLKTAAGKPVSNGKITLVAMQNKIVKDTITDQNGNFSFDNVNLPDSSKKVILQARDGNNRSNVAIYIKQPDLPPVKKLMVPGVELIRADTSGETNAGYQQNLKEDSLEIKQLKGVVVEDKKEVKPDIYNRYGAAYEYDVDLKRMQKNFARITDALLYSIPGLGYYNSKYYFDHKELKRFIIDDQISAIDDLNSFLPQDIESLRIITSIPSGQPKLVLTTKRYAGTDTASTIKLKQVDIHGNQKQKNPVLVNSANLNGSGNADQVIMGDQLIGCVNLSDCLQSKVFGVSFKDGTPYAIIRARRTANGVTPMIIIVDGTTMPGSSLNNLSASDVYSVEVLRSAAYLSIYGSNAPGGALVITTRHGGDPTDNDTYVTSTKPAGLITYPFRGYSIAKEFYSPKYNHPKTEAEPFDLRTTIYWNPNLITDKSGNASFEYFNADTKGTYRIVIEGIDDNGNLGRQVYRYKVE